MNEDAIADPIENESDQPITMEEAESESSTEAAAEPEQKTDGVQKRINEITAKRYEAERRAETAERKLAEQTAVKTPEAEPVTAPNMPDDVYDGEAMAKFNQDNANYSAAIARQEAQRLFDDNQRAGQQAQQQAAMQQVVSTYAENAVRDGVDIDKLRAAEQVLTQEGINPELGRFILNDPNGGKIVEYLNDNPTVRHDVLSLDPISAGHKILSEVKALALSTTPRVSNAPDPIPDIRGGGALDKDDFDRKYPATTFI
jgi:hypothetical protein